MNPSRHILVHRCRRGRSDHQSPANTCYSQYPQRQSQDVTRQLAPTVNELQWKVSTRGARLTTPTRASAQTTSPHHRRATPRPQSAGPYVVPGDEAEAHAVVDHGEVAARELGSADELATEAAAGFDGSPTAAAVRCNGADAALAEVFCVAALDEDPLAAFHGVLHLQSEACLSQIGAARSHQIFVEPVRAIMGDMPVQPDGGEHPHPRAGAVSFPVIGQPARGKVLRHTAMSARPLWA